jgi:hypothetical protein
MSDMNFDKEEQDILSALEADTVPLSKPDALELAAIKTAATNTVEWLRRTKDL